MRVCITPRRRRGKLVPDFVPMYPIVMQLTFALRAAMTGFHIARLPTAPLFRAVA